MCLAVASPSHWAVSSCLFVSVSFFMEPLEHTGGHFLLEEYAVSISLPSERLSFLSHRPVPHSLIIDSFCLLLFCHIQHWNVPKWCEASLWLLPPFGLTFYIDKPFLPSGNNNFMEARTAELSICCLKMLKVHRTPWPSITGDFITLLNVTF